LKKRILYIILGVLLFAKVGVGQVTFTSSTNTICAGDNAYTITFKNTVNTQLFFYIESSNKNQNNWSTVVSTQTLNSLNNYTLSSSPLIFTSKDFRVKYSTSTDSEGNLVAPTTSSLITIDVNPNTSITGQPSGFTVCAGGSSTALNVTATGTGAITYQWYSNTTNTNSGGTLIGSATNASYTPSVAAAGTYYYYVVATSSCSNATSNAVTVTVNPNTSITGQPSGFTVCAGGSSTALNVTATGTGAITYQWYSNTTNTNSGGTLIGSATNASYTPSVAAAGTYYYYVVATSSCSNATSNAVTVTVNPNTSITGQPSGFTVCAGGSSTALNVTATGTGAITYQWYSNTTNTNSGGTLIGSATNASYTPSVAAAGTYYYYVVATSSCSNATSNAVTVTVNPNTSITGQPSGFTVCAGGSSTALNVTATGTGAITYQWYSNTTNTNSGGTLIGSATNASYTPSVAAAGTYYYYVVATSSCSNATSNAVTVTVNPNTSITGQPSGFTVCAGGSSTALNVTATGTGAITYQWYSNTTNTNSGGTLIGSATNASYTPSVAAAGTYYYYVVATSSCSNATSNAVTVTVNPNTSITGQPSGFTVCAGGSSTALNVTATGTGAITYQWYSNTTNTNSGGTLIGSATNASYTPSVAAAGTYYYYVVATSSCSNATSNAVTVTVNPNTSITGQPSGFTVCAGGSSTALNVTATGTGAITYQWYSNTTNTNSGGTLIGSATNASYTPSVAAAGTYYYYVVATSSCSNATSNAVTVTVNPNTSITGQPSGFTVCAGGSSTALNVTATGTGAITYQWYSNTTNTNSGGTLIGSATNASYTPSVAAAGTYYYYVVATSSCSNATSNAVTVTVNPNTSITGQPSGFTVCAGGSSTALNVTATGTGAITYQWYSNTTNTNSGGTLIGSATNASYTPSVAAAGTYYYYVVATSSCSNATSNAVTVTVNPNTSITGQPSGFTVCAGGSSTALNVTATGTGAITYQWYSNTTNTNSGGTLIGSATNASYTPSVAAAGTYYYYVVATSSCSNATSNAVAVVVNPLPTVTATSTPLSGAVCIGDNVTLNGSGAASYTWSGGVTNGTAFAPTTTTTYTVTGTDANGCVNTATKLVTVNLLPTVTATSTPLSGAVCIGNNATLNGGGAASYTWSGGVTNGTAFAPTTTTTYTVTGTDANGCVNTATKLITVTSLPTAAPIVASDNKVIENKTLNLTAAASGGTSPYNFIWTPNSTINYSISGQENAVFNALKEGKVNIKYQVKDANNCEANSADFEITIEPEEIVLVLPNAFTPNGDGINDEFKIVASNLLGKNSFRYFEIYNRNGKLMKRVDNISGWWDGIYNNVIQDMGVYFVKLVKLNKDGQLVADNLTFYLLK
jgi:large repetitive protein